MPRLTRPSSRSAGVKNTLVKGAGILGLVLVTAGVAIGIYAGLTNNANQEAARAAIEAEMGENTFENDTEMVNTILERVFADLIARNNIDRNSEQSDALWTVLNQTVDTMFSLGELVIAIPPNLGNAGIDAVVRDILHESGSNWISANIDNQQVMPELIQWLRASGSFGQGLGLHREMQVNVNGVMQQQLQLLQVHNWVIQELVDRRVTDREGIPFADARSSDVDLRETVNNILTTAESNINNATQGGAMIVLTQLANGQTPPQLAAWGLTPQQWMDQNILHYVATATDREIAILAGQGRVQGATQAAPAQAPAPSSNPAQAPAPVAATPSTPAPVVTPAPESTPVPRATPEPMATPGPVAIIIPEPEQEPTPVAPTPTPAPTATPVPAAAAQTTDDLIASITLGDEQNEREFFTVVQNPNHHDQIRQLQNEADALDGDLRARVDEAINETTRTGVFTPPQSRLHIDNRVGDDQARADNRRTQQVPITQNQHMNQNLGPAGTASGVHSAEQDEQRLDPVHQFDLVAPELPPENAVPQPPPGGWHPQLRFVPDWGMEVNAVLVNGNWYSFDMMTGQPGDRLVNSREPQRQEMNP